jgi:hypothetical protein
MHACHYRHHFDDLELSLLLMALLGAPHSRQVVLYTSVIFVSLAMFVFVCSNT